MEKRSLVLLPSAARRRSLRSGSVPAGTPPALHFAARRTADRSRANDNEIAQNVARGMHKLVSMKLIIWRERLVNSSCRFNDSPLAV
jgi:hypothetical protein